MELTSDSPLTDPSDDRLGRWKFSKRIAESISSRQDPSSLTVGIHGPWGEGKTTVLNFIEHALEETNEDSICLRFNPWRTGSEEELLVSFFQSLADALDRSLETDVESMGKIATQYAKILKPLQLDKFAEAAGEAIGQPALNELKERVESALKEEERKLVVFLDDIDRMEKSGIQSVFKLIKLVADFDYVNYVLAFDQNLVAQALKERYPSPDGRFGYNFLEKIIQVPLRIPAPRSRTLRRICGEGIDNALDLAGIELTESQRKEFGRRFARGIAPALKTPRMAERYTNILSFTLPILEGEVHPIDQILIEGIRVFYPDVHNHIRFNRDLYLDSSKGVGIFTNNEDEDENEQRRMKALEGLTEVEQSSLRWLIGELFPATRGTRSNENRLREEKRVASEDYFDRYFSYNITQREVSDVKLERFITQLKRVESLDNGKDIAELFTNLVEESDKSTLLTKLRTRADLHNENSAHILAVLLAKASNNFPRTQRGMLEVSPFQHGFFLIRDLLEQLSHDRRKQAIRDIIERGYLPLAGRLVAALQSTDESESPFPEIDPEPAFEHLATRIESVSEDQSLIKAYPKDIPRLLYIWKEVWGSEPVANHVEVCLDDNPDQALILLKSYAPTVRSTSGDRVAPDRKSVV